MLVFVFLLFSWILFPCSVSEQAMELSNCRVTMKEPRGVITTPDFPNPYPVPISCQWVIEAPADKVIAVYFTQFYMREGLKATEYAYYSPNVKMGKTEFGTISSEREPTYLVSNKPVLVLDFAVRERANIHMRVREFLLDVFGFNITYEMIARNESVRKDACLYHHCSFTGNCYASAGFDRYYCSCFAKYFGDECQYDVECGPTASRNMCQNGGTCRYYIGSTVRTCECPPGYDGARCESIKTSKPVPAKVGCSEDNCNTTCSSSENNDKVCLAKEDRERFIVYMKLTNPKVSAVLPDKKKMENFKRDMERDLYLLLHSRLNVTENITVLELRPDSVMKFHLLAKKTDTEELKSTVEQMLKVGKLGSFDFDQEYYNLESEDALKIEHMEVSETMPISEGNELTLACMVKGSNSLQVEWFKDNYPVYIHTKHRGMWTTIIPKNSQGLFTALLVFDRASNLDSGLFTCKVSDWGFVQNRSIAVEVHSAPQPQLSPMTATIFRGNRLVVTCLSREDLYGTFGYTWLKNGQILNPSVEPEMIEDLFPAGSRVLLRSAKNSATYTCIISSSAGSTRKDSVITVLEKDRSIPSCPPEDYMKVKWALAASNTEDRQLCPAGYTGDVKRKCALSSTQGAYWEEPDFSGCFSSSFLTIQKKVDSLKLGYLMTNVSNLLSKVRRYLLVKRQKLHVCEGEPVVDLLDEIQQITHADKRSEEGWKVFLDIVSILLETPKLIRKHSKIIQLHELIFKYGFQYAASIDTSFESFGRKYLAVEVGKIHQGMNPNLKFPTMLYSESKEFQGRDPWMSNSVELNLNNVYFDNREINSSVPTGAVVAIFYKNFSSYVPQRLVAKQGLIDIEYQLISSLVEIRLMEPEVYLDNEINVKVKLANFNYTVEKHIGWNISCAIADFSQGRIQFTTSGCHVVATLQNITVCNCNQLGTFALILTHYSLPEINDVDDGFQIIAGAGCAICAFLVLITLFLLLYLWRRVRRTITVLKLQICFAVLSAYLIFFCSLQSSLPQDFYPYTVTLIQFFLLTTFSLQLCLALAVYIECLDQTNIHYSSIKIASLGWAIPVIVLGATLAAQSLEGFQLHRWWLSLGSTFFYAYMVSVLILTVLQVILLLVVKSEIRNHGKVADFMHRKRAKINMNRVKLLHRSLLITTSLLLVSVASVLYVNFDNKIFEYVFATSSVLLGLIIFLSYTFCSEKHFILCCLDETKEEFNDNDDFLTRSRNNSFKSFLKPEIIDDAYTSKLNLDSEKRSDRIRRMYSQIEKASLATPGEYPHSLQSTTELLTPHHQIHQGSLDDNSKTVIITNRCDQIHQFSKSNTPKCRKKREHYHPDGSDQGYHEATWKYTSPSHIICEPSSAHINYNSHLSEISGVHRPLLLESSLSSKKCSDFDNSACGSYSDTCSLSSSTFHPPHVIKADVTNIKSSSHSIPESFIHKNLSYSDVSDVQDIPESLEDKCDSLKTSCFMHHTDSLETVVYCDDSRNVKARNLLENDGEKNPLSWNMTSV